jgi:hypothetical protein
MLRVTQALLGVNDIQPGIVNDKGLTPPNHFGYRENASFSDSVKQDSYFVDSIYSRVFLPSVYPEYQQLWSFTPSDFNRLDHQDPGVDTIYSDGEFWVYHVNP